MEIIKENDLLDLLVEELSEILKPFEPRFNDHVNITTIQRTVLETLYKFNKEHNLTGDDRMLCCWMEDSDSMCFRTGTLNDLREWKKK